MSALIQAASHLQRVLDANRWRFCFIGGIAVLRWGEPRMTRDVDVTVLCAYGREAEIAEPLLAAGYQGRISDVREFAQANRVVLLQTAGGVPIDVALGALPFEESMIERSGLFEFEPDATLRTCSAEDLIVLKLFAFRQRDILDVEAVVARHRKTLDWEYIEANLGALAAVKEEPEILATLRSLRKK